MASSTQTIVVFQQSSKHRAFVWTMYNETLSAVLFALITDIEKFISYGIKFIECEEQITPIKLSTNPLFETLTDEKYVNDRSKCSDFTDRLFESIVFIDLYKQKLTVYHHKIDPAFIVYTCSLAYVKSLLEDNFTNPNWEPSIYVTMSAVGFTDEATFHHVVNELKTLPDIIILQDNDSFIFRIGYLLLKLNYLNSDENLSTDYVFHASVVSRETNKKCIGEFIYRSIQKMFKVIVDNE